MNKEKIADLAGFLTENVETGEKLMMMPAEEAAAALKKQEYDFTAEDLTEMGRLLLEQIEKQGEGELNEEMLENVNGGFGLTTALLCATVIAVYHAGFLSKTLWRGRC